ncbi:MAG: glycosyltransferase family 4 protein [Betaproteobacteria bacterium]
MRILQINSERGWRGGERQTLLTALGLRERGHEVALLVRAGGALEARAQAEGLPTYAAKSTVEFAVWLARYASRYDVLHVQTANVLAWALLAKAMHRRPVIFSRRTSFPAKRFSGFLRLKWACADVRVAISDAAASAMREMGLSVQIIPSAVPAIVPNVSRIQEFLARENLFGHRLIGTAAALSPEKDPVTLIHAAAKVCAKYPDVIFVHWGAEGAAAEAARRAIHDLGMGDRYRLLGFEAGVEQLYPALTVYVMASRHEALGSSVLDAMLQGVPVAATQAGGLEELLAEKRGLLGPVGDAQMLADNIGMLLSDSELSAAIAQRGRDAVTLHYSVAGMVQAYEHIYQEMLRTH